MQSKYMINFDTYNYKKNIQTYIQSPFLDKLRIQKNFEFRNKP